MFEEFQPVWSRYLNVTDGQTAGQTIYCGITALCVASPGKNVSGQSTTPEIFYSVLPLLLLINTLGLISPCETRRWYTPYKYRSYIIQWYCCSLRWINGRIRISSSSSIWALRWCIIPLVQLSLSSTLRLHHQQFVSFTPVINHQSRVAGIILIIAGTLSIVFNIIGIVLGETLAIFSHGIWCGIMVSSCFMVLL